MVLSDRHHGSTSEVLSWDIESILSVSALGGFVNGSGGIGGPFDFVNVFQDKRNIEFQRTYDVSAVDLQQILTDGSLNIFC